MYSKCQTCSARIQNQGEVNVDCGGPCQKCVISYPAKGFYGANILRSDTLTIKSNGSFANQNYRYSLMAVLLNGSKVKVRLIRASGSTIWRVEPGTQNKWTVGAFDSQNGVQNFTDTGKGTCDRSIMAA